MDNCNECNDKIAEMAATGASNILIMSKEALDIGFDVKPPYRLSDKTETCPNCSRRFTPVIFDPDPSK